MGYFPNGSAGMDYEQLYCRHCVHFGGDDGPGCPVWLLHLLHNYDECNKKDSFLHTLIPLEDGLRNERCTMFIDAHTTEEPSHRLPLKGELFQRQPERAEE